MLAVGDIASDAAARFGYVSPAVREAVVMCYACYAGRMYAAVVLGCR
jgi:hypothetical protein